MTNILHLIRVIPGLCLAAKRNSFFLSVFLLAGLISSCSTTKVLSQRPAKSLHHLWDSLDIAGKYHTGLSVYDPEKKKFIFNYREDNFFTPASNIKLLTFYVALQYLDEHIPAAYYTVHGDTMTVWGGGDPGTKYPSIKDTSTFIEFLKATDKKIVFSNHHFQTTRFGSGWSWDDFPYNYQPERTAFPIYGNKLWVERYRDSIVLTPKYLSLVFSSKSDQVQKLTRDEWGTNYLYRYNPRISQSVSSIPISLYENDIRFIWQEAIGKNILFRDSPLVTNTIRLEGSNRDTILKLMLQESENFIAEQILLACAFRQTGIMNEKDFIKQVLRGPLAGISDSIAWVDGSGLSRYNQLTPRSVVWLLDKSLTQKGPDFIKKIFAAGGQSGTLNNSFHAFKGKPYVFAKSGSMRNVYNLSGLLITDRGHILLFSWMNNNFSEDTDDIIKSMEKFLAHLRDHY